MKDFIALSFLVSLCAQADPYKDLKSGTEVLDSYYEGAGPHEAYTCQKGREVMDLIAYLPTQEICKLSQQRRLCAKWLSKDKKCATGSWKKAGREQEIFKGKGSTVGPNECHKKMEQKVAQLKAKGFDCHSNQYE